MATHQDVDSLDLATHAKACALLLCDSFPDVKFTSGRRSIAQQAKAMAQNVVRNRRWIGETYRHGASLQGWIDRHPEVRAASQIEAGLLALMQNMKPEDLAKLSKHFTGMAFDLEPIVDHQGLPTARGFEIVDFIRQHLQGAKVLLREGGLVVWHVQFDLEV